MLTKCTPTPIGKKITTLMKIILNTANQHLLLLLLLSEVAAVDQESVEFHLLKKYMLKKTLKESLLILMLP